MCEDKINDKSKRDVRLRTGSNWLVRFCERGYYILCHASGRKCIEVDK